MLRVRVLGELGLERDGKPLPAPRGHRLRGLLGWLALHPGPHARAELAGRLWPDVLDESARTSLRTALADLRRELGDGPLVATREEVALAPDVWVDAREFDVLLAAGRLDDALALVRGPLLAGLADEWVYAERDRHEDRVRAALARRAAAAEAAGDLAAAVARTRQLVALDRLSEASHRELVRRLAAAGDRPAALAAYAELRELLARELGVAPSEQTRRLVDRIRAAEPPPPLPGPLARRHRSPFVARAGLVQRLRGQRLALVGGEAGIGKTRLAAELARILHAEGAVVLYGRADEEPIAPYQPFAEALRPYLVGPAAALRALAGPFAAELARLAPGGTAEAPDTRDPAGSRYRLFEAVVALLAGAAAERPLLLVLDDLHWADRPTLLLLRHVARADLGRTLILGTFREHGPELAAVLGDLHRDAAPERVTLEGLAEDQVDTLVTAWLGAAVPGALTASVWRETGGNPFFVEELLRHLRDSGPEGVPEGVAHVLEGRLARLGEPAREIVLLAAVAGPEADVRALELAGGRGGDALAEALDAALTAHLLREDPSRPGRYLFAHALVREALYERIPPARRGLLHGRLADALERLGADDAEVARHHLLAGDRPEKAVEFSARAGRRAMAQLAYEDAVRHFERAAACGGGGALLAAAGEAHLRAGEADASRARFSAAAAAARETGDAALLARAALGRSGLGLTVLGHDAETVALLEEALAAQDDPALRARLLGRLAIEVYHQPPASRREELSAEAVALARSAGDPGALVDALSARHVALWSPPHLEERLALAREMVSVAAMAGDRERALQGRNWHVLDLLESGDVATARLEIDEHGRLADELRLPGYQWWAPMWRAMLAFLEGRLEDAERLRAEAVEIGRRAGDRVAELFDWIQAVFLDLEREPLSSETSTDVPDRVAVQAVVSAFRSDLPLIYAEMGRTEDARRELEALAADRCAGIAPDMNWLASISGLAQAAALVGARDRAAELYELLLPYRGRAVLVGRAALCLGPVELQLGVLACALGRFDAADGHLDAATRWAEAAGARPWAAWAKVHRAELLGARGEPAAALARQAAREAAALGFGRAAARARALVR